MRERDEHKTHKLRCKKYARSIRWCASRISATRLVHTFLKVSPDMKRACGSQVFPRDHLPPRRDPCRRRGVLVDDGEGRGGDARSASPPTSNDLLSAPNPPI